MPRMSLGTIEVLGLPAAVEAADVALKAADVTLIGYETTDGMGMVAVKIEGQVSAVQSAVAAARAAAGRVSKVFATSVIPRPSDQLDPIARSEGTVGLAVESAAEPVVEPEPVAEDASVPEPEAEPVTEPADVPVPETEPEPAAAPEAARTPRARAGRSSKPATK
ncbi:MAG TPA: BMC domain-containing protein [Propionicimonas sp.]|nr:BMC domain-containing protein [Propionicimonas sp.]